MVFQFLQSFILHSSLVLVFFVHWKFIFIWKRAKNITKMIFGCFKYSTHNEQIKPNIRRKDNLFNEKPLGVASNNQHHSFRQQQHLKWSLDCHCAVALVWEFFRKFLCVFFFLLNSLLIWLQRTISWMTDLHRTSVLQTWCEFWHFSNCYLLNGRCILIMWYKMY